MSEIPLRPIDRIVAVHEDVYERLQDRFNCGEKEIYQGKDGDIHLVHREDDGTIWDTNRKQIVRISEVLAIAKICIPHLFR